MDRAGPGFWRWQQARRHAGFAAACVLMALIAAPGLAEGPSVLTAMRAVGVALLVAHLAPGLSSRPAVRSPEPCCCDDARSANCIVLAGALSRIRTAADTALGCAEILAASSHLADDRRAEFQKALLDNCRAVSLQLRQTVDMLRIAEGTLQLHDQQLDAADLAEVVLKRCADAAEQANVTVTASLYDGVELRGDASRLHQAIEALVRGAMMSAPGRPLHVAMQGETAGGLNFIVRAGRAWEGTPNAGGDSLADLGLPVARRIALLHGGDVTIAPARDHGTEYRLTLPPGRVTWPPHAGRTGRSAA